MNTATRRLGFDSGHRVTRHESKCRNVHGHRYEAEITVEGGLDHAGRVVDFGAIKERVGTWIDEHLDHGYIHAADDTVGPQLAAQGMKTYAMPPRLGEPTAENLAALIGEVAERLLLGLRVKQVRIWETPNCWADWFPSSTQEEG